MLAQSLQDMFQRLYQIAVAPPDFSAAIAAFMMVLLAFVAYYSFYAMDTLDFRAPARRFHSFTTAGLITTLAIFPAASLVGSKWGLPFPLTYPDYAWGGPMFSFSNFVMNFIVWYVLAALQWLAAAFLESRLACWAIAAGAAAACCTQFLRPWDDNYSASSAFSIAKGFPVAYLHPSGGGSSHIAGDPAAFMANAISLALLALPAGLAISHVARWGLARHTRHGTA